jgi:hypothetical protein
MAADIVFRVPAGELESLLAELAQQHGLKMIDRWWHRRLSIVAMCSATAITTKTRS